MSIVSVPPPPRTVTPRSVCRPVPLRSGKPGLITALTESALPCNVDSVLGEICKYIGGECATVCRRFSAAWRLERKSIYVTTASELQRAGAYLNILPSVTEMTLVTAEYMVGDEDSRLTWDRILANSRLRHKITVVKIVGDAPVEMVNTLFRRYNKLKQVWVADEGIVTALYTHSRTFILGRRAPMPDILCAGFAPTASTALRAIRFSSMSGDPEAQITGLLFRDTVVFTLVHTPEQRYMVMRDMAYDFGGGKVRLAVVRVAAPIQCGQDALDVLQAIDYALCILPSRPDAVRLDGAQVDMLYWPLLENPTRVDLFDAVTRDVAQLISVGKWIVTWAGYPAVQKWARHLYAPLCDRLRQLDDGRWEVARNLRDACMHAIYRLFVAMGIRRLPEDCDGVAYRLVHLHAYLTPTMSYNDMGMMMGYPVTHVPRVDIPMEHEDLLTVVEYAAQVVPWRRHYLPTTLGGYVLSMIYRNYVSPATSSKKRGRKDVRMRLYECIRTIMDITEVGISSPLCAVYLASTVKKHQYAGALLVMQALDGRSYHTLVDTLHSTKDPVSRAIAKEYRRLLAVEPMRTPQSRGRRELYRMLVYRGLWRSRVPRPSEVLGDVTTL